MVEAARGLSLELMSFDVAPNRTCTRGRRCSDGGSGGADQGEVGSGIDPHPAEQFLTKQPDEREGLIRLVMEGHLRGIIGQLTVEEIVKQPEMVGERMRSTAPTT